VPTRPPRRKHAAAATADPPPEARGRGGEGGAGDAAARSMRAVARVVAHPGCPWDVRRPAACYLEARRHVREERVKRVLALARREELHEVERAAREPGVLHAPPPTPSSSSLSSRGRSHGRARHGGAEEAEARQSKMRVVRRQRCGGGAPPRAALPATMRPSSSRPRRPPRTPSSPLRAREVISALSRPLLRLFL